MENNSFENQFQTEPLNNNFNTLTQVENSFTQPSEPSHPPKKSRKKLFTGLAGVFVVLVALVGALGTGNFFQGSLLLTRADRSPQIEILVCDQLSESNCVSQTNRKLTPTQITSLPNIGNFSFDKVVFFDKPLNWWGAEVSVFNHNPEQDILTLNATEPNRLIFNNKTNEEQIQTLNLLVNKSFFDFLTSDNSATPPSLSEIAKLFCSENDPYWECDRFLMELVANTNFIRFFDVESSYEMNIPRLAYDPMQDMKLTIYHNGLFEEDNIPSKIAEICEKSTNPAEICENKSRAQSLVFDRPGNYVLEPSENLVLIVEEPEPLEEPALEAAEQVMPAARTMVGSEIQARTTLPVRTTDNQNAVKFTVLEPTQSEDVEPVTVYMLAKDDKYLENHYSLKINSNFSVNIDSPTPLLHNYSFPHHISSFCIPPSSPTPDPESGPTEPIAEQEPECTNVATGLKVNLPKIAKSESYSIGYSQHLKIFIQDTPNSFTELSSNNSQFDIKSSIDTLYVLVDTQENLNNPHSLTVKLPEHEIGYAKESIAQKPAYKIEKQQVLISISSRVPIFSRLILSLSQDSDERILAATQEGPSLNPNLSLKLNSQLSGTTEHRLTSEHVCKPPEPEAEAETETEPEMPLPATQPPVPATPELPCTNVSENALNVSLNVLNSLTNGQNFRMTFPSNLYVFQASADSFAEVTSNTNLTISSGSQLSFKVLLKDDSDPFLSPSTPYQISIQFNDSALQSSAGFSTTGTAKDFVNLSYTNSKILNSAANPSSPTYNIIQITNANNDSRFNVEFSVPDITGVNFFTKTGGEYAPVINPILLTKPITEIYFTVEASITNPLNIAFNANFTIPENFNDTEFLREFIQGSLEKLSQERASGTINSALVNFVIPQAFGTPPTSKGMHHDIYSSDNETKFEPISFETNTADVFESGVRRTFQNLIETDNACTQQAISMFTAQKKSIELLTDTDTGLMNEFISLSDSLRFYRLSTSQDSSASPIVSLPENGIFEQNDSLKASAVSAFAKDFLFNMYLQRHVLNQGDLIGVSNRYDINLGKLTTPQKEALESQLVELAPYFRALQVTFNSNSFTITLPTNTTINNLEAINIKFLELAPSATLNGQELTAIADLLLTEKEKLYSIEVPLVSNPTDKQRLDYIMNRFSKLVNAANDLFTPASLQSLNNPERTYLSNLIKSAISDAWNGNTDLIFTENNWHGYELGGLIYLYNKEILPSWEQTLARADLILDLCNKISSTNSTPDQKARALAEVIANKVEERLTKLAQENFHNYIDNFRSDDSDESFDNNNEEILGAPQLQYRVQASQSEPEKSLSLQIDLSLSDPIVINTESLHELRYVLDDSFDAELLMILDIGVPYEVVSRAISDAALIGLGLVDFSINIKEIFDASSRMNSLRYISQSRLVTNILRILGNFNFQTVAFLNSDVQIHNTVLSSNCPTEFNIFMKLVEVLEKGEFRLTEFTNFAKPADCEGVFMVLKMGVDSQYDPENANLELAFIPYSRTSDTPKEVLECNENERVDNGQCVPIQEDPEPQTCSTGFELKDGSCVITCESPQVPNADGTKCEDKEVKAIECRQGQTLVNGQCVTTQNPTSNPTSAPRQTGGGGGGQSTGASLEQCRVFFTDQPPLSDRECAFMLPLRLARSEVDTRIATPIVTGDNFNGISGEANLSRPISRQEFLTIATRLYRYIGEEQPKDLNPETLLRFTDINQPILADSANGWWILPITELVTTGVVRGYRDGTLRRLDPIIGFETGKVALEILITRFKNDDSKDPWYSDTLSVYNEAKIPVTGENFTRGQAFELVHQTMLLRERLNQN